MEQTSQERGIADAATYAQPAKTAHAAFWPLAVGPKVSRGVSLRQAAATIFALTAMLPLLLFMYSLSHFGLLTQTSAQLDLALALLIALLGFVVFNQVVSRISRLAEAMRVTQPVEKTARREKDASLVPGLGRVTEIGDFAQALGRLLEDLKSSTERLEDLVFKLGALNETVELAARIPKIQDLLAHVLERMMRAVRAGIGSIMLLDPERQTLRIAVARGLPNAVVAATELRAGEGIAGKVVDLGEPVLVENLETDPRFAGLTDAVYGSGSFISLPLRVGERIIGVVNLAKKEALSTAMRPQAAFGPTDLQFLNALVTHTAYAVDNARLLEEARRSAEQLHQVVEDQKLRLTLAQQQMVQAAKLSALGQLVAGVAHELNNPLTVLLGYTDLLSQGATESDRGKLEAMQDAADSARRIVQGLLMFARRLPLARQQIDVGDLVEKVLNVTAADLRLAQVRVEHDIEPDIPRVWADLHQLQQVLVNLITNAKQAMAEVEHPRRLRVAVKRAGSDRIRIAVEDTGCGIPSDLLPTIFDPFVTTKGAGGTGLGLSISYGIIREHEGEIRVDSVVGAGTTFTIELPIGAAGSAETTPVSVEAASLAGKSIMVVEDNELIQEMVRTYLEEAGCRLLAVKNAEEALNRLREPLDLLLVDCYLPGMSGLDFHREAVARHPALAGRFLFTTGGVLSDSAQNGLRTGSGRLLQKPFSRTELLEAVHEVLG